MGCVQVYGVFFFFQAEDGIRDDLVTGVQTCALPIFSRVRGAAMRPVRFLPNPITKRQMGHRRAPGARGASLLAGRISPARALVGAALLLIAGFLTFGRPASDDVLA